MLPTIDSALKMNTEAPNASGMNPKAISAQSYTSINISSLCLYTPFLLNGALLSRIWTLHLSPLGILEFHRMRSTNDRSLIVKSYKIVGLLRRWINEPQKGRTSVLWSQRVKLRLLERPRKLQMLRVTSDANLAKCRGTTFASCPQAFTKMSRQAQT